MDSRHTANKTKKKAIIIGCGISGATAAEELEKLGYTVIILEKNNRVGGKLKSISYPDSKTQDLGAMVFTANHPAVDSINRLNLEVDPVLLGNESVNQMLYETQQPSLMCQLTYGAKLSWQYAKFALNVWQYNQSSQQYQSISADHELNFQDYVDKYKMKELANFMKIWVPGMGYGSLSDNYVFRVINYMGYGTIPSLCLGKGIFSNYLLSVHDGFQKLIESMVKNKDVRMEVEIQNITRENGKVTVSYLNKKKPMILNPCIIEADLLVLTMSPYYWGRLGMKLNELETECIDQLDFVRYPVAICDLKGYPANQIFVPSALEKQGLGHIGFITTKDIQPRPDGSRRVVIHMNLARDQRNFSLNIGSEGRNILLNDLKNLGYDTKQVNILETKIWKDYNPSLPYQLGMELEKSQGKQSTIYVGSYSPLSFESVASAENYTRQTIQRVIANQKKPFYLSSFENFNRAYTFFFRLNQHTGNVNGDQKQNILPANNHHDDEKYVFR